MDLFLPIVLFIVFCVLFSICGWCCKKHREGTVYGYAGNNVTVSTQPAAAVIPPYPVDARHQQPQQPMPGFASTGGYQTSPYPATATPYPPAPAPGFYYPPPLGGGYPPATPYPMSTAAPYPAATPPYPPTSHAPYPPASAAPYSGQPHPPTYMEAVGHPPAEPHTVSEGYTKQAPYNPHY